MWFIENRTSRAGPAPNRSRHIERVARRVAAGDDPADVVAVATAELAALLASGSCRFEAPPWLTSHPRLGRDGCLDVGPATAPSGEHTIELVVGSDDAPVGRFVIVVPAGPPPEREQYIAAVILADHVALAHATAPVPEPGTEPRATTRSP